MSGLTLLFVDLRVSAMFTNAVSEMFDDCSDWLLVVIATTASRSSLTITLHDLFVHRIDIDVCTCLFVCVSVHACMHRCVHACVRACMRACVRACMRVCVRACLMVYVVLLTQSVHPIHSGGTVKDTL